MISKALRCRDIRKLVCWKDLKHIYQPQTNLYTNNTLSLIQTLTDASTADSFLKTVTKEEIADDDFSFATVISTLFNNHTITYRNVFWT